MAYATIDQVREMTSFSDVASLSDSKITNYLERATAWIHRIALRTFEGETDPVLLSDLKIASVLLVEYLWFHDHPDIKESELSPLESEKIGSYSYTMKDVTTVDSYKERVFEATRTGYKELDLILQSLIPAEPTSFFFRVSGPSDRRGRC
jgi:hypothetical protein